MPEKGKFADLVQFPLSEIEKSLTVADLTDQNGAWCLDKVIHFLPKDVLQFILNLDPPTTNRPQDRITWKLNKDGEFSTSSTYECLLSLPDIFSGELYKLIWMWPGPERVRIHL